MSRSLNAALMASVLPMIALGGCVSFGAKAPPQLLTLRATQVVASNATLNNQGGPTLTVMPPDAPHKLDTVRVPVQINATSVAYVKDAQWADTPRQLFQKLLSETIAADGKTLVLQPGQYWASPGRRLMGALVEFGVDAGTHQAIVTYDATLTAVEGARILRKRFSATAPAGKITADRVAGPINTAANQVAADVAAWVKEN
ncbi:MAG: ABC-type transport auxiliary lipoprotein family protein [Sphingobium sp.]